MMTLWIIILSIISGGLYRLGGWGDEGRDKFPNLPEWFFNTKARDLGCAGITLLGYQLLANASMVPWFIHLLCFLLLFGSLTTYWDELFGYDNFYAHGLACGLAYIPYGFYTGDFTLLIVRAFVIAIMMGAISQISGNDVVEEMGRGASLTASLPVLLI